LPDGNTVERKNPAPAGFFFARRPWGDAGGGIDAGITQPSLSWPASASGTESAMPPFHVSRSTAGSPQPAGLFLPALIACASLGLGACQRDDAPPAQPAVATAPAPAADAVDDQTAPVRLEDAIERDAKYIIGISYPSVANQHPGLARALKAYADQARGELLQAVAGLGDGEGPYDLSLAFTELVATDDLVAVAADGSSYTGGEHGTALVARFVWLPARGEMLTAEQLLASPAGWRDVSAHVREQLHAALSQEADAGAPEPAERAGRVRESAALIEAGTRPEPGNFNHFEPVLDGAGKISALRFVFPPEQVGPYRAGTQSVEVPAAVLLPHMTADYRGLFAAT
jgi:hypothetical protein